MSLLPARLIRLGTAALLTAVTAVHVAPTALAQSTELRCWTLRKTS